MSCQRRPAFKTCPVFVPDKLGESRELPLGVRPPAQEPWRTGKVPETPALTFGFCSASEGAVTRLGSRWTPQRRTWLGDSEPRQWLGEPQGWGPQEEPKAPQGAGSARGHLSHLCGGKLEGWALTTERFPRSQMCTDRPQQARRGDGRTAVDRPCPAPSAEQTKMTLVSMRVVEERGVRGR